MWLSRTLVDLHYSRDRGARTFGLWKSIVTQLKSTYLRWPGAALYIVIGLG